MAPIGYIISVTTSDNSSQPVLTILRLADSVQMLGGSSNERAATHLFLLPVTKKSKQELIAELQLIANASNISVVSLSQPIKEEELTEVRKIFAGMSWDTSNISDRELSVFLDDKLQGQCVYYMDAEHKKGERMLSMRIKHLKDQAESSPEGQEKSNCNRQNMNDGQKRLEEFETRKIVLEEVVENVPPPPPPPSILGQMTDEQIIRWVRKNDDRIQSGKGIKIIRTSEAIQLSIMIDGEEETVTYKLL